MSKDERIYTLSLSFEVVSLPPFRDILLLGKRCPHGKQGMTKCLDLMAPDNFEAVEVGDENIEAMLVNKNLIKRVPLPTILDVLRKMVFPYVNSGETVRVDFKVKVSYPDIQIAPETANEDFETGL